MVIEIRHASLVYIITAKCTELLQDEVAPEKGVGER